MARTRSALRNSLLCLTMIAGCIDSGDHASLSLPAIVDGDQIAAIPWQGEVGTAAVSSPGHGWTESSPGLWKGSDDAMMIIGAAGHRAAIAEAEQRLAVLEQGDSRAEIEQQVAYLGALQRAEQDIAKPERGNALPPVCAFNFYIGPSTPAGAGTGGAALASAVCTQACQVMTSTSRVCTNLVGCTQVQTQSALVCGAPVLFGTIAPGSPGSPCNGAVTMLPPGVGTSTTFACG